MASTSICDAESMFEKLLTKKLSKEYRTLNIVISIDRFKELFY
jgi:hypothetical protein